MRSSAADQRVSARQLVADFRYVCANNFALRIGYGMSGFEICNRTPGWLCPLDLHQQGVGNIDVQFSQFLFDHQLKLAGSEKRCHHDILASSRPFHAQPAIVSSVPEQARW